MTLREKLLKGGMTLVVGQIVSQGLAAVRNILIARMILSEYDYGIASTMIMIISLIDALSNLGTNLLVIQHANGDQPHFLNVVHFVSSVRSLLSGLALVAISYPLACLFDVRQASWAYAVLALVPILKGLTHHDLYRLQRNYAYGPIVLQEVLGQILTIGAWYGLTRWVNDYGSVAYLLILQAAINTMLSHIIARYPYRWAYDLALIRHVLGFGLPLMYNWVVMFLVYQAERFIVSSGSRFFPAAQYNMQDTASISAAMLISSMASLFLNRVITSLFMPLLSQMDDNFLRRYRLTLQTASLIAGLSTIPLILFSGLIVQMIYLGRYTSSGAMISFTASGQALLILRSAAHVGLLGQGRSWDCFYNNLWRSVSVPLVIVVAATGLPVTFIAYPALVGEAISLIALAWTTKRRFGAAPQNLLAPVAFLVSGLGAAYFLGYYQDLFEPGIYWTAAISLWIGFGSSSVLIFPELFAEIFRNSRRWSYRSA
jgi:O-antigen/teichoic acid export membrane protein